VTLPLHTEIESGKRNDLPQLDAAIASAKKGQGDADQ
jgi:hypothetical protein